MPKATLKKRLLSVPLIFLIACSIPHSYSRSEIDKVIKNMCKDEFGIDVSAWSVGDTIWVYAPFTRRLADSRGNWDKQTQEDIRNIFLSLSRIFLNMEKPPKFYCLIVSDTVGGIDVSHIGFVPDKIKLDMNFISISEFNERLVFDPTPNTSAIGDKAGEHIRKYDITIGDFIAYLVRQHMERTFTAPELLPAFKLRKIQSYYHNSKLSIMFDIKIYKYDDNFIDPFEEAKKAVKKYLRIYNEFEDIVEIEIRDTFNNRSSLYSKKALLERN